MLNDECQTRFYIIMGKSVIKGFHCFLEHETLPVLLKIRQNKTQNQMSDQTIFESEVNSLEKGSFNDSLTVD